MPKLVVKGVSPVAGVGDINGSYEIPHIDSLKNSEIRFIKREAGVRFGELNDAFDAGDNDVLVAITLIALARAGKEIPSEALWEAEIGCITFDLAGEDDAGPPEVQPDSPGNGNGNG